MRGRPQLYTSYAADQALLNTGTKRLSFALFGVVLLCLPLGFIPGFRWAADADWMLVLAEVAILFIAALGLNLLTGLAGQVSLGHAFFMGVGAYVAAILGSPEGPLWGLGLPIWVWLPAAGLVAAAIGVLIAPTSFRVRGLYLAIVTLGLVFIGEHLFRNLDFITGGSQSGRTFPPLEFKFWKEETPFIDFATDGDWFGVELTGQAKTYYLMLGLALIAGLVAKNIQRTRAGRAFQSIRDRDIAAEITGVDEFRYKTIAFALSSFFAGVAGALFASFVGRTIPEAFGLPLSVEVIAIVLIGGAGVVSGMGMGAAFVIVMPLIVRTITEWLTQVAKTGEGVFQKIADVLVSTGTFDPGLVSASAGSGPGLNVFQLNQVLYGLLIVGFIIFEPLGLYGIWLRVRNYWKGWPFTY
ncbi:MAG: branched-chain amino acid ABC transporter permease [Acidimicrobiia bacterium]|nr:branched-chain amino acid ABC transporter permease [Acidimicrobiia bacterium]MDH4308261.1 branched-chain amino acid ABC transporter permease [Acidimicrobiia bacterium]MDH5292051.1 branched-chain amino acid ABC transporter permease [Acidimicrobiia bacterium]